MRPVRAVPRSEERCVAASCFSLDFCAVAIAAAERQLDMALQQARFSAAHARRQYDAVDPDNRLVASELERRWNEALQVVHRIEGGFIEMVLHWRGGDHTALKLKMNGAGKHRWTVPEDTLSLIRELARLMPDQQIARLLNRAGKPTGRGNGWTKTRVCSFRNHHGIAVHREGEWVERGEMTLEAAAQIMDVSIMTALRMIRRGIIKGRQLCRGAPWVINAEDMAAYREQNASQRPLTPDLPQQSFQFQ